MRRFGVVLVLLAGAFPAIAVAEEAFDEFSDALLSSPERYAWQEPQQVMRMLSVRSGERVAEIGSARGFFTEQFALRVGETGRVFMAETNPDLVAHLREMKKNFPGLNGEILGSTEDDLALPGDLDMVFTVNTWHHLKDRKAKREAVQRALKPGGRFVVIDWRAEEAPMAPPLDHRLARKQLIAEMKKDGWTVTTDARLLKYQYLLIFTPPKS